MAETSWRDDLDNLLACAGEAQWVEEADERLTALLERADAAETALTTLCSYVGAPYYPDPESAFSAAEAEKRIRWGIDHLARVPSGDSDRG